MRGSVSFQVWGAGWLRGASARPGKETTSLAVSLPSKQHESKRFNQRERQREKERSVMKREVEVEQAREEDRVEKDGLGDYGIYYSGEGRTKTKRGEEGRRAGRKDT